MITFAKRNLKLFFRDRASVFFSLLAVFIIIGLYVLFLGDMVMMDLEGIPGARFLMDSWIMAGLMAVTSVTTTMGALGIVVEDRAKGIYKDFHTSPVKRTTLVGGYLISTLVVGVVMSLVALVLSELYIVVSGGEFLPWGICSKCRTHSSFHYGSGAIMFLWFRFSRHKMPMAWPALFSGL